MPRVSRVSDIRGIYRKNLKINLDFDWKSIVFFIIVCLSLGFLWELFESLGFLRIDTECNFGLFIFFMIKKVRLKN